MTATCLSASWYVQQYCSTCLVLVLVLLLVFDNFCFASFFFLPLFVLHCIAVHSGAGIPQRKEKIQVNRKQTLHTCIKMDVHLHFMYYLYTCICGTCVLPRKKSSLCTILFINFYYVKCTTCIYTYLCLVYKIK